MTTASSTLLMANRCAPVTRRKPDGTWTKESEVRPHLSVGGGLPGLSSFCLHPELQSEEPFVVRLLFEPSGRPDSQQDYYLTAKENLCVVCGKADSYIR